MSPENPVYLPWEEGASSQLHPFVFYSGFSIIASAIAALFAAKIAQWWFQRRDKGERLR